MEDNNNEMKRRLKEYFRTLLYILIIVAAVFIYNFLWDKGIQVATNLKLADSAEGPYLVERVVDGDTIICDIDGEKVKVRMIGINTPESVAEDESRNCEEGVIASDYTKELLDGEKVFLEYDEEKLDQYDRTLAYVYLSDGEMIESLLLEKGYATTMYREPNTKYADLFSELMKKAKNNKEGFWGTGFYK